MVKKVYVPTGSSGASYMTNDYTYVDETSPDNDSSYVYNTNNAYTASLALSFTLGTLYASLVRTMYCSIRARKTGGSTSKTAALQLTYNSTRSLTATRTVSTSYGTTNSSSASDVNLTSMSAYISHAAAPVGYQIRTTMCNVTLYFDWKHKFFGQNTRTLRPFGKLLKNIAKVQNVE